MIRASSVRDVDASREGDPTESISIQAASLVDVRSQRLTYYDDADRRNGSARGVPSAKSSGFFFAAGHAKLSYSSASMSWKRRVICLALKST
jgi:hypothetical protein